jgi:hypothetical protein
MRYFLQLSILLTVLGTSAAFGADRIRLAQTQTAPALPPQATAAGTCAITCDSAAMNCLNTCVGLGPASPANPQCSLSCTTQQLICKQRC